MSIADQKSSVNLLKADRDLFFNRFDAFLKCSIAIASYVKRMYPSYSHHFQPSLSTIIVKSSQTSASSFMVTTASSEASHPDYLSPEETGQITNTPDFRAYFYSLGIMFYEMLTKSLPELDTSGHPMFEFENTGSIPQDIQTVILKCCKFFPEDRYQDFDTLISDLNNCLTHQMSTVSQIKKPLFSSTQIWEFNDILYSRDHELELLQNQIKSISTGPSSLILISGHSGVGKTSLIQKAMTSFSDCVYIQGKCDRRLNEPFSSIFQALRQLSTLFAHLPNYDITVQAIHEHLGHQVPLLTNLISEFELLFGSHPPLEYVDPIQSSDRFRSMLVSFFKTFIKCHGPIVIFLDDLQWSDQDTLLLVFHLLSNIDEQLLVIGAYRNNHSQENLPLNGYIDDYKSKLNLIEIHLSELSEQVIQCQLSDLLNVPTSNVQELARLVHQKTLGNPFYIRQFLTMLLKKQLISLNEDKSRWSWDISVIENESFSENVADLVLSHLTFFPERCQSLLKLASCMGNTFGLSELAELQGETSQSVEMDLFPALMHQLIFVCSAKESPLLYRFSHDKIQQAALNLIPKHDIPLIHLNIANYLVSRYPDAVTTFASKTFKIADHFHFALDAIDSPEIENKALSVLYLAGIKSKENMAYKKALTYFSDGQGLILSGFNTKKRAYFYDFTLHQSECYFLLKNLKKAELGFNLLTSDPTFSALQKSKIFLRKVILYTYISNFEEAIHNGIKGLRLLNQPISYEISPFKIFIHHTALLLRLKFTSLEVFESLPELKSEEDTVITDLYTEIAVASYFKNQLFMVFCVLKMLRHTLKYGQNENTLFVLSSYSVVLLGVHLYRLAYHVGYKSMQLLSSFPEHPLKSKTLFVFDAMVSPWVRPLEESSKKMPAIHDLALKQGNHYFMSLASMYGIQLKYFRNYSLATLISESSQALSLSYLNDKESEVTRMYQLYFEQLKSNTSNYTLLEKTQFNLLLDQSPFSVVLLYLINLKLSYFNKDYQTCIDISKKIQKNLFILVGNFNFVHYYFYTLLAYFSVGKTHRWTVYRGLSLFKQWSNNCPENFYHLNLILKGEQQRVRGNFQKAESFFKHALSTCEANQYTYYGALSAELCGNMLQVKGDLEQAKYYLTRASTLYKEWGAIGKALTVGSH